MEHIIHAGDIGAQWILDELELIAPVSAVLGNCDYPEYSVLKEGTVVSVRSWEYITLAGLRIFIAHKPEDINHVLFSREPTALLDPLPHVCIHGHTHVPRDEMRGAIRMLCPGSPTKPRGGSKPTVLILDIPQDASVHEVGAQFVSV